MPVFQPSLWGKALNAKYSVSLCLPFLSGTLPPPELFTAYFEEELEQLRTELIRQRLEGEWNLCNEKWCKEMVTLVF